MIHECINRGVYVAGEKSGLTSVDGIGKTIAGMVFQFWCINFETLERIEREDLRE